MKIGLVLPAIPSYSETFFITKINSLKENGFEVVLFVINEDKKNTSFCKTIHLPNFKTNKKFILFISTFLKIILNYKKAFRLYQLNRRDNFTIKRSIKSLFLNSPFFNQKLDWLHFGFGTMALGRENVAKAIEAKMAVSFRGFDFYIYPEKHQNCYDLLFSKKVKYHVLSEAMKTKLNQKVIDINNIIKITPAIKTDFFFNHEMFKEFKDNDTLNILTIARLHWIKGLNSILEALSILNEKKINFQYTIIGDGNEKERLQFAVYQLGLKNKVSFLGKLTPSEVKKEIQKSEIYIQYSHQEGFCNAVLEAQAMGKICIVSDADGLLENVLENITGFVVPKRCPLKLADKLIEVNNLSNEKKLEFSKNASNRVKNEFSIEKQKEEFKMFYEK